MKYTFNTIEKGQTQTGKDRAVASITSEEGENIEKITLWKTDWPTYDTLTNGMEIEGNIVAPKDPKYPPTLYPPRVENKTPMRGAGAITKAMEKKEAGIAKAQDNKQTGIKVSSTMRMAHETALRECEGMPFDVAVFKGNVNKWRKWYWENFDAEETDFEPFPSRG